MWIYLASFSLDSDIKIITQQVLLIDDSDNEIITRLLTFLDLVYFTCNICFNYFHFSYSSIFNDFVESEFFLIDGDSLLVTSICEKSLKQGQELHFFYLVERYLLDLLSKGGQFAIVFFKVICDSWMIFYALRTKKKISYCK